MVDFVAVSHTEWWCPIDRRWTDCPGPCPNGMEHTPRRTITGLARQASIEESSRFADPEFLWSFRQETTWLELQLSPE